VGLLSTTGAVVGVPPPGIRRKISNVAQHLATHTIEPQHGTSRPTRLRQPARVGQPHPGDAVAMGLLSKIRRGISGLMRRSWSRADACPARQRCLTRQEPGAASAVRGGLDGGYGIGYVIIGA